TPMIVKICTSRASGPLAACVMPVEAAKAITAKNSANASFCMVPTQFQTAAILAPALLTADHSVLHRGWDARGWRSVAGPHRRSTLCLRLGPGQPPPAGSTIGVSAHGAARPWTISDSAGWAAFAILTAHQHRMRSRALLPPGVQDLAVDGDDGI